MRINVAVPESHVDAPVLDAALESVTRLNEAMLAKGQVKPFEQALHEHGIRWKPEPPGAEHFDHAHTVTQRGWGDCDDLAPWQAASLRHSGEDPEAQAVVYKSGPKRWHAVVRRGDGSVDDPSKRAGMGRPEGSRGATVPVMQATQGVHGVGAYEIRPQIAMRPVRGAWQARADIPWNYFEHQDSAPTPSDYAMTALHTAPVASTALVGAIEGAIILGTTGGFASDDHLDRLEAISGCLQGLDYDELSEIYGEEHAEAAAAVVGSFFGRLSNIVRSPMFKKVMPWVSKGISFIPGVGPVASTALDVATQFIPPQRKKASAPGPFGVPQGPQIAQMLHSAAPHLSQSPYFPQAAAQFFG